MREQVKPKARGRPLRVAMLEAGLDVKVAAAQVGLSPSQLSRIRRGRPTSVKTARLLCRSVGRLWGEIFESDGGPVREED